MAKTQQGWFNKMKCICSGPLDRNTHSTNYACQLLYISEFSKKKRKRNVCEVGILYNRSRQLKWIYKGKGSDSTARAMGWKYLRYVLRNFCQSYFLLSYIHFICIYCLSSTSLLPPLVLPLLSLSQSPTMAQAIL